MRKGFLERLPNNSAVAVMDSEAVQRPRRTNMYQLRIITIATTKSRAPPGEG